MKKLFTLFLVVIFNFSSIYAQNLERVKAEDVGIDSKKIVKVDDII